LTDSDKANETRYPRISVVTPSYNQGHFLEACLESVLNQDYPNLEYVVVDGVSRDRSQDIIRAWEHRLDLAIIEPDRHQYDAIQKGFERTSGEIMAWLNSDDLYLPGALHTVGEIMHRHPEIQWLTSLRPYECDESGRPTRCRRLPGYHRDAFRRGEYVNGVNRFWSGWVPQESTFWRRSLWESAGSRLDPDLVFAGDFELWCRFIELTDLVGVDAPLGVFRRHDQQKTATSMPRYIQEARSCMNDGDRLGPVHGLARMVYTRLPAFLRSWNPWLGYRAPTLRRSNGQWQLQDVWA